MSVERLEDRLAPAAGALDLSFSGDGKVTTHFADPLGLPTQLHAEAVVLQPDGMIIAAGEVFSYSTFTSDFAVVRYHPDGRLDTGFGNNGIATADFTDRDTAHSVALQADGKIVVAGQVGLFTSDFALARFNSDGSPDLSFGDLFSSSGPGGKVTTDFANGFDVGSKVVITADGKILVAGFAQTDHGIDFGVARYTSDGRLDTSFDTDGRVTTDFGGEFEGASDMALQADGKIVAVGSVRFGDNASLDFALARYNANGSPDTGFGTGGTVITDVSGDADFGDGLLLQANGKIVVAGAADIGDSGAFALARYNSDGSPDTGFDGDGKVTTFTTGGLGSVAFAADGKIIAAGSAGDSNASDFALTRFNADGSLDTSFGTDGQVTTDFGADDLARAVTLQPDGKIVVAGGTLTVDSHIEDLALARYEGSAPEIAVSVGTTALDSGATVAYGSTLQGTPISKTFIIRNLGNLSLTVSSITVPTGYNLTSGPVFPFSLAPGAGTKIAVQLTGSTAGIFSGRVSIRSNDSNEDPFVINVTGTVLAPAHEIQVLKGTTDIPDETGLVNFGTFTVNSGIVVRTFTVRNVGNTNLTLGTPTVSAPAFIVTSGFGSTSLAPGASTSFALGFKTATIGIFSAEVSFATNDSDENPFNFTVFGGVNFTSSAPMIRGESLTREVDEGGVATLRGHLIDLDSQDELFLSVDWGDGTSIETHAVGRAPFALQHRYLDDAPSGAAADDYQVHFTWFDSGGGSNSRTLPVTVANVAPQVSVGLPALLRTDEALTRLGSFTDPGLDSWYATVDYGDGRGPQWLTLGADNAFTLSHVYARPGDYHVRVRVFDDDGGVGTATLDVTVRNAPPQLVLGGTEVVRIGEVMRHTGTFTDPDSNTWRATVDYGDGAGPQPLAIKPGQQLSFEHRYTRPGEYRVTVTVLDDDGGLASDSFVVTVLPPQ